MTPVTLKLKLNQWPLICPLENVTDLRQQFVTIKVLSRMI